MAAWLGPVLAAWAPFHIRPCGRSAVFMLLSPPAPRRTVRVWPAPPGSNSHSCQAPVSGFLRCRRLLGSAPVMTLRSMPPFSMLPSSRVTIRALPACVLWMRTRGSCPRRILSSVSRAPPESMPPYAPEASSVRAMLFAHFSRLSRIAPPARRLQPLRSALSRPDMGMAASLILSRVSMALMQASCLASALPGPGRCESASWQRLSCSCCSWVPGACRSPAMVDSVGALFSSWFMRSRSTAFWKFLLAGCSSIVFSSVFSSRRPGPVCFSWFAGDPVLWFLCPWAPAAGLIRISALRARDLRPRPYPDIWQTR